MSEPRTLQKAKRPQPLPKRHHFVPEMLQKRFIDPQGWLHGFTKTQPERGVYRSRPSNLFLETHLYSEIEVDGRRRPDMEHHLSRLEDRADPILRRIVEAARADETPNLTVEEKDLWFLFLMIQWKRVPDLHLAITTDAELSETFDDLIAELREVAPHRGAELDALQQPDAQRRLMQNARVGTLGVASPNVVGALRSRGIAILRVPRPDKRFVLGSRPVVKLTSPGKTDVRHPECEMWLPIADDVAVGLGQGPGREVLLPIGSDHIRQLNLASALQSSTFASSSPALVRSLARPR